MRSLGHNFGRIPESKFVAPVVGFVEQLNGNGLAGEVAEIDGEVLPFDVFSIAFDDGLMPDLTVDNDD